MALHIFNVQKNSNFTHFVDSIKSSLIHFYSIHFYFVTSVNQLALLYQSKTNKQVVFRRKRLILYLSQRAQGLLLES